MTIWFASGNAGKKKELVSILDNAILADAGGYELRIPKDEGLDFDPEETGDTFHANALLKAGELYSLLNRHNPPLFKLGDVIIADDSGICVDALDGRPGLHSAYYAGSGKWVKNLTAAERNNLLLEELVGKPHRTARFICSMVLLYSPDRFFITQETLEGEIVKGPEYVKGTAGFGYDPIFFIPEFGRTVAELSENEKNTISHRAKAGKVIANILNYAKTEHQS